MITGTEMAVVDANAAALGVPRKQLMESSGNAVARAVRAAAEDGPVHVVAGRGNNGGDALVAARFLDDYDPRVTLLGRPEAITTSIARENWEALVAAGYDVGTVRDSTAVEVDDPDVVVDAMLGTGMRGELREPERTAAAAMNDADATVVSVDVPSGLDVEAGALADTAVDPDHVVTFHDTKPGLEALDAEVTVADIGIPDAAEVVVERGDLRRLDRRRPDSHKGQNGEVLVVGGGPYAGAPALAGRATLRTGADLVSVACPAAIADTVQGYDEGLIVEALSGERVGPDHVDALLAAAADADTVVVGPGLGDHDDTTAAVRRFLSSFDGTAVVDADALVAVPAVETAARLLCTPHRGELAAMADGPVDDVEARVETLADRLGATLLTKGPRDVVSDGETTRINRTGTAAMTVGGTGDVLAGVAGALACRLDPLEAAAVAAYATGRAGEAADGRNGGLVATDLLETLPAALRPPA